MQRDIVITINVVEPYLVRAVNLLSNEVGRPLHGLVLVDKTYATHHTRPQDKTNLFKEFVCDFTDPDEMQKVLKPYTDRLLLVTCRYEEAIQPFGKAIPYLPYLFTPTPASLTWSTEKPQMRDRLRSYDPSIVPRYQRVESEDLKHLKRLVKDFAYPVIVKPAGLSKSLLVSQCNNFTSLREQLEATFKVIHEVYIRDRYPGKPAVLIEEMMQGEMFSVDSYVMHDGRVFCLPPVKVVPANSVGLPGFYCYEERAPAYLSEEEVQKAHDTARAAIRALNLRSTTTHTEMYRTADGWKVIEIAARIGGYREMLYREAYGTEHFLNDLKIRMGMEPVMPDHPISHAAALDFYAESEGTITAIDGIEKVLQLSSTIEAAAHARPGDKALFSTNGGDIVAHALMRNEDLDQLEKDIATARKTVTVKVE